MLSVVKTNFTSSSNDNALVYLVQNKKFTTKHQFGLARENTHSRMELFHMSLSYFVDHVHPDDMGVDIHVFHEGDLTTDHALRATKTAKRYRVFFHSVRFECPAWLDPNEIQKTIDDSDIPGWRDMGYRHMCRFYSLLVYPQLLEWGYKKMMRLDDDSFPLETLPRLFGSVSPENPYMARITQKEGETFRRNFYPTFSAFCQSKGLPCPAEEDPEFYIIPFNNFFVVDLSLYQRPIVQDYLAYMDRSGGIYRYRWGDALVQGIMVKHVAGIKDVPLFTFRYAKWGIEFDEDMNHLELYQDTTAPPPRPYPLALLWVLVVVLLIIAAMGCFLVFKR